MTTVLALVGSLRSGSVNHAIARQAQQEAPAGVQVTLAEGLGDLPFYSEDIDGDTVPDAAQRLREQVLAADAVLLITPEYNGGLPAVLKNAIDWASRPYGQGSLREKPLAALGASLAQYGGLWAQQDALKAAGIAGAKVHEQPAASLVIGQLGDTPAEHESVRGALQEVLQRLDQDVRELAAA